MKIKKPTLSVFIPAFNEEANIARLLKSLIKQGNKNFDFEKIEISLDASTDNTEGEVRNIMDNHKIIKLIKNSDRRGKYYRLNQAFRNCKTDILVVLDADIGVPDVHFLEKLTAIILEDSGAEMIAAHQILLRPKGIISILLYTSFLYWDNVRLSLPNLNSPLNYFGSATAYRGSFARSIKMPTGLRDPHLFIYLKTCKNNGFRYTFEAKIFQWPVTTFKDIERFLRRAVGKGDKKLEKLFSKEMEIISKPVSKKTKLIGIIKTFRSEPLFTPFALCFSFYMGIKAKYVRQDKTAVWDTMTSTKKPL